MEDSYGLILINNNSVIGFAMGYFSQYDDGKVYDLAEEEEVYQINSIELTIGNQNIELENISVLKRDVFPTSNFKVIGLLAADIIQDYKCVIDYTNNNFELI